MIDNDAFHLEEDLGENFLIKSSERSPDELYEHPRGI
jgi:hypothetical protein